MKVFLIAGVACLSIDAYSADVLEECKRLYETRGSSCIFANNAQDIYKRNNCKVRNATSYDELPDDIFGYTKFGESLKQSFKIWVDLKNKANEIIYGNLKDPFSSISKYYNKQLSPEERNSLLILCGMINDEFNNDDQKKFSTWLNKLKINKKEYKKTQTDIKLYSSKWGFDDNPLNYIKSIEYDLYNKTEITANDLKGITAIHEDSFNDETLQKIAIPDSVESIDAGTFVRKEALYNISVPENWRVYKDKISNEPNGFGIYWIVSENTVFPIFRNKEIFNKTKTIVPYNTKDTTDDETYEILKIKEENNLPVLELNFSNCPSNKNITKLTGTYRIFDFLFNCADFYKWKLNITGSPAMVEIGDRCFAKCSNLIEVRTFGNFNKLGKGAFSKTSISTLIDTDFIGGKGNDKEIDDYCFSQCEKLKNIYIDLPMKRIGSGCFKGCDNIDEIWILQPINIVEKSAINNLANIKNIICYDKQMKELLEKVFFNNQNKENIKVLTEECRKERDKIIKERNKSITSYEEYLKAREACEQAKKEMISQTANFLKSICNKLGENFIDRLEYKNGQFKLLAKPVEAAAIHNKCNDPILETDTLIIKKTEALKMLNQILEDRKSILENAENNPNLGQQKTNILAEIKKDINRIEETIKSIGRGDPDKKLIEEILCCNDSFDNDLDSMREKKAEKEIKDLTLKQLENLYDELREKKEDYESSTLSPEKIRKWKYITKKSNIVLARIIKIKEGTEKEITILENKLRKCNSFDEVSALRGENCERLERYNNRQDLSTQEMKEKYILEEKDKIIVARMKEINEGTI